MRNRNRNLSVRLTEEEWNTVKNMQAQTNLNTREFLLTCIRNTKIYTKPYGAQIVAQLKAMGNNLNQLTRKVNSGQIKDCSSELENIYQLMEVMMKVWQ